VVELLPGVIHVEPSGSAQLSWSDVGTLRLTAAEARELRPGGEAVITRAFKRVVGTLPGAVRRRPSAEAA